MLFDADYFSTWFAAVELTTQETAQLNFKRFNDFEESENRNRKNTY
jgi:hypothetical protein